MSESSTLVRRLRLSTLQPSGSPRALNTISPFFFFPPPLANQENRTHRGYVAIKETLNNIKLTFFEASYMFISYHAKFIVSCGERKISLNYVKVCPNMSIIQGKRSIKVEVKKYPLIKHMHKENV